MPPFRSFAHPTTALVTSTSIWLLIVSVLPVEMMPTRTGAPAAGFFAPSTASRAEVPFDRVLVEFGVLAVLVVVDDLVLLLHAVARSSTNSAATPSARSRFFTRSP